MKTIKSTMLGQLQKVAHKKETEKQTNTHTQAGKQRDRQTKKQRHTPTIKHLEGRHTNIDTATSKNSRSRAETDRTSFRQLICATHFLSGLATKSPRQCYLPPQLFSDPGKKGEPFLGRPFLVGQSPKKKGKTSSVPLKN